MLVVTRVVRMEGSGLDLKSQGMNKKVVASREKRTSMSYKAIARNDFDDYLKSSPFYWHWLLSAIVSLTDWTRMRQEISKTDQVSDTCENKVKQGGGGRGEKTRTE